MWANGAKTPESCGVGKGAGKGERRVNDRGVRKERRKGVD